MAKVSMKDNAPPQIGYPVGGLEELRALGLDDKALRNIRSCSESCPVWYICDRSFRGTRPQLEVVRKVNRNGKIRVYVGPCYDTVHHESVAADNFESYTIIGHEGDEYTYKGSEKLHPQRDPNCNDCSHGRCEKYVDRNDLKVTCPTFPPAAEHPELVMFAERVAARQSTGVRTKEALDRALLPGSATVETVNVTKEKPRFGSGSRS